MKHKELAKMGNPELQEKLKELKKELMKENAQVAIGTAPKNPGKISQTKKTIAKIKSIITRGVVESTQQTSFKK